MLAIYKKEMKSYFISMIGYAFMAFLLLVVSFCVYMTNFKNTSPFIGYAFDTPYIPIIFMILVPMITMKIFADEKATRTDQMLFTAPVSIKDIVWGKFLATATLYTIPIIVVMLYPIVLSDNGNNAVPMLNSYVAIFGFWLMGLAYFAVGMYISAITENQVISAVATFAVLFFSFIAQYIADIVPKSKQAGLGGSIALVIIIALIFFIASKGGRYTKVITGVIAIGGIVALIITYIVNPGFFTNALQNILYTFCIDYNLIYFLRDFLDIPTVIYYVSIIAIALFLTIQTIQKKRG